MKKYFRLLVISHLVSSAFSAKSILKMALSCLSNRILPNGIKVQGFRNLMNHLERPRNTTFRSQLNCFSSKSSFNHCKNFHDQTNFSFQSILFKNVDKQFSTSAVRLGGHKGHDHSKIWSLERLLSLVLIPLTPAALLTPCHELDTALALLVVMHTHFGLEAIIVDYVRPILFGHVAPKIGIGLLYIFSVVTFAGLLNLIYNDNGLANAIINVWKK